MCVCASVHASHVHVCVWERLCCILVWPVACVCVYVMWVSNSLHFIVYHLHFWWSENKRARRILTCMPFAADEILYTSRIVYIVCDVSTHRVVYIVVQKKSTRVHTLTQRKILFDSLFVIVWATQTHGTASTHSDTHSSSRSSRRRRRRSGVEKSRRWRKELQSSRKTAHNIKSNRRRVWCCCCIVCEYNLLISADTACTTASTVSLCFVYLFFSVSPRFSESVAFFAFRSSTWAFFGGD